MARRKYDMINEVLAHFDFDKVHRVMKALNWTWVEKGVPDVRTIKESAEERMSSAIEQVTDRNNTEHQDIGWVSYSGGLKATAWRDEDYNLARVQLEFIVTEWDVDDEEIND